MNRHFGITPITFLLLLSSCAQLPDDYGLYQEPPSAWAVEQNNNRISAIESLVLSGKSGAAKQQADLVNNTELTKPQAAKFNLLYAQILLSFGEAEQAVQKLKATDTGELSINDKIRYFQSSAFAHSLTGNLLESAKARISLDPLLTQMGERKKNQALILESLGLLPESVLQNPQNQANDLPAWLSIAKILGSRNQDPARFNVSLASWRAANPEHAANIYLSGVENMAEENAKPSSIAILLPESGPYADAGKAVKAGFLAAQSKDSSGQKPALHFYDTEKAKANELYDKAVADGARLIIGPLNKESIQILAKSATLDVPVLALNYVPELNKKNLFQFALSPMDDVAEITQKAASDGHKMALLLVPENEQSKRVISYFSSNWQALNGGIAGKQTYDPKAFDYSEVLKKLLNSDKNNNQLDKTTSSFSEAKDSQPPGQGADVLFLSAYSKEGRSINSQLQIQQVKMPVYAMPAIYSGIADPASDNALNGVTFCDMPWLFDAAYGGDLSMKSLQNIWSQFPNTYIRLLAMGIDAYHLGSRLTTLESTPYPGATGNLSLTSGNRIKRSLVCARFNKGMPELTGFTHSVGR